VGSGDVVARLKGRAVIWWAIASFVWFVSIPLCLLLAHDLDSGPPPNLRTWVTVAEFLPVIAIPTAALSAGVTVLRRGAPMLASVNAAKGLLWCSVVIVLIALPKAP